MRRNGDGTAQMASMRGAPEIAEERRGKQSDYGSRVGWTSHLRATQSMLPQREATA